MIGFLFAAALAAGVHEQPQSSHGLADLQLGMKKADVAARLGVLDCRPVVGAEVPTHATEVCQAKDGGAAVLIAPDQAREPRLIAYTISAPAGSAAAMADALTQQFGRPTRGGDSRFGHSLVWLQASRQVSFRSACGPARACLEVSHDAFARRVARSTGLFVPATPGA